jgi:hypothetical protein
MNLCPVNHDQWLGTGIGDQYFYPGMRFAPESSRPGRRASGDPAVIARRNSSRIRAKAALLAAITLAALAGTASPASAQGIFDSLFGRRSGPGPSASAYADPFQFNPFAPRAPEAPGAEMAGTGAFCVRLCDGRFFPITRNMGVTPAQTCSSFCPASQTKVYNGSSIDHAVAADGRRYSELGTAFVYREKIVAGCTCNGRDAFGLVNIPVGDDPTLRPGDIVATNSGLMAYNGHIGRKQTASFTPIASYSGLSSELRRKLTGTKIEPAEATPAPPPPAAASQGDTTDTTRGSKNKRVQAAR